MDGRCDHARVKDDGVCADCGACTHEVIVNGACYVCGETDVVVTVKPTGEGGGEVVPASRLTGRRR